MKDSEVLWAARENIARGWHQGGYTDGYSVCALGAINMALGGRATSCAGHYNQKEALKERLMDAADVSVIALWNDNEKTTKQDVLNAFEKAAITAEEQGQ